MISKLKDQKSKILATAAAIGVLLLSAAPVFAHAVVSPKQAGVAAFVDFSLSVPSEKDASTTSVKLMLPASVNIVTPVVKPGWKVVVKSGPVPAGMQAPKAMDGDVMDSIPTEIDWTGGSIPSGQKDLFTFSVQTPAQPTELDWKVYQGFSDGSTVSWDLGPNDSQPKDDKGNSDFSSKGPYSKTMVINDLANNPDFVSRTEAIDYAARATRRTTALAVIALALGATALAMQLGKKK